MQVPFHPVMVHFPIALAFILPILILVFAFMIKSQKMSHHAWLVIIGLQIVTTVTGYVALDSGEKEEHAVEKVLDKKHIHHHEESAEIFVGSTVLALVISIAAFFLRKPIQFYLQLGTLLIALISCYLVYQTGHSGGELVYRYGAANAYGPINTSPIQEGIVPTPGLNTSESPAPEENESLKKDDNDYGNADESSEIEDEDSKQED
jgi:uncharacterized membrane protein